MARHRPIARLVSLSATAASFLSVATPATAQCTNPWLPGQAGTGTDGGVAATAWWDPDGAGPLPSLLVVGGTFATAGTVAADNIAVYDPVAGTWSALGSGLQGSWFVQFAPGVTALATLPNGDLVAAGSFTTAGAVGVNNIARWNGSSWSALGSGTDSRVQALTVLPNGHLVATGDFASAGGVGSARIARWNGVSWSPLGSGLTSSGTAYGSSLATLPSGEVVVAGSFQGAGGVAASGLARWNGTSWSSLGATAPANASVTNVTALANGDLIAMGSFTSVGGVAASRIARWNGSTWSALGPGLDNGMPRSLLQLANGDLIAAGSFTLSGTTAVNHIAHWSSSTWSPLGSGLDAPAGMLAAMPNGDVLVFGTFGTAGGIPVERVARWNGTAWAALGPSTATAANATVTAVLGLPNGDWIAGGDFTAAGGMPANRIARWNGVNWTPLGSGTNGPVYALALLPNGNIVAGGGFASAGGVAVARAAQWDGIAWSPLGAGMDGSVHALLVQPDGSLVAGGQFTTAGGVPTGPVAVWDGANWSALGAPPLLSVLSLTEAAGDLVAAGFAGLSSLQPVARWDGTSWTPLTLGSMIVQAAVGLPGGDIAVAGGGRVLRWNGASWLALGLAAGPTPSTAVLAVLPDGDLLAGGAFDVMNGIPATGIARLDGSGVWSSLGTGLTSWYPTSGAAAFCPLPGGDVLVGGAFTCAGSVPSINVARLSTTCPATATPYGVACTGSGGLNLLLPSALPWLGGTFRATATGMPASGFVVAVSGFTQISVPLSAILSQGGAGCTALVSLDHLELLLPAAGLVQTQLFVPDVASLVGAVVHHQVAPFETNASALTAVTSTNALTLTLGRF